MVQLSIGSQQWLATVCAAWHNVTYRQQKTRFKQNWKTPTLPLNILISFRQLVRQDHLLRILPATSHKDMHDCT